MTTVVFDNQPVHLLVHADRHDPRRRRLIAELLKLTHATVPSVVRVEANAPRSARNADLNRFTADAETHPLLAGRAARVADLAISARSGTQRSTSVVDAVVAATAASLPGRVEVLTSDPRDLEALRDAIGADFHVVTI